MQALGPDRCLARVNVRIRQSQGGRDGSRRPAGALTFAPSRRKRGRRAVHRHGPAPAGTRGVWAPSRSISGALRHPASIDTPRIDRCQAPNRPSDGPRRGGKSRPCLEGTDDFEIAREVTPQRTRSVQPRRSGVRALAQRKILRLLALVRLLARLLLGRGPRFDYLTCPATPCIKRCRCQDPALRTFGAVCLPKFSAGTG